MADQTEQYHKTVAAAKRIREQFHEARDENYYRSAWYARLSKWDVETLVEAFLGPDPRRSEDGLIA